jgi:hypothetical protein
MTLNQIIFILIIILVISAAVLVGVLMYQHQAYVSNQRALTLDMNNIVGQVFVYWKTPTAGGGANQSTTNIRIENLAAFTGFTSVHNTETKQDYYSLITENGEFRIKKIMANIVVLQGIGKYPRRGYYPQVQSTVNLYNFVINTNLGQAKAY